MPASKSKVRPKTRRPQMAHKAVLMPQALKLRTEGYGYAMIGEKLGIPTTTAYEYVKEALNELAQQRTESAEELRAVEAARLDLYQRKLIPKINRGHIEAIKTALKVAERRAKLFGIDGAQKIEVSLLDMLNTLQQED